MEEKSIENIDSEKSVWGIMQGTSPEGDFLIRKNNSLEPFAGHNDYPFQVGVAVSRIKPSRKNWPTKKEQKLLYKIEDELEEMFKASHNCILAVIITSDVMRELVFYAKNKDFVINKLEPYTSKPNKLRIQFIIQEDKDWEIYRSFGETS